MTVRHPYTVGSQVPQVGTFIVTSTLVVYMCTVPVPTVPTGTYVTIFQNRQVRYLLILLLILYFLALDERKGLNEECEEVSKSTYIIYRYLPTLHTGTYITYRQLCTVFTLGRVPGTCYTESLIVIFLKHFFLFSFLERH